MYDKFQVLDLLRRYRHQLPTFTPMVRMGRIQELQILRKTGAGLVLGDDDDIEVLLPKEEEGPGDAIDQPIKVFVHHDRDGRPIATRRMPKAQVGEFANMKMLYEDRAGAYMDWGLEPELLVPHEEQQRDLMEERWYVVRVTLNDETGRIHGSTFIDRFLDNRHLTVRQGQRWICWYTAEAISVYR